MFKNDEEDEFEGGDASGKPGIQMINKAGIMGSILQSVQNVQSASGTLDVNLPDNTAAGNTKSISEILEEREQELKDLERFKDMKNSQFVDALAADMGTSGAQGGSTVLNLPSANLAQASTGEQMTEGSTEGTMGGASTGAGKGDDVANEIQAKFEADTETLVRENEEAIATMVKTLEGLKAEIGGSQTRVE